MKQEKRIDNVLIFGNGPVGLHLYITLKNQNCNKIGMKIRDSLKSKKFLEELQRTRFEIEGQVKTKLPINTYGKVKLQNIIKEDENVFNEWETFILATPCDCYLSLLETIPLKMLNILKTILLVSPELGSAYFLQNWLNKKGRNDIEVISFSNYFGATNLVEQFSTKICINALKGKIYLSGTKKVSKELDKWVSYLENMGIKGILCKNPLIAESKNITVFVHSPLLFNDVSLNQIFLHDIQKRYIYKLYPEGPITKYCIEDMVEFYHEIMELYQKMGIETFNLLKFLNDSYPVLEETLHIDEIDNFMKKNKTEQIFLLYVRYCCILIDPYSVPNKEGRYFDFSKVEYSKIYLNKENKWIIPRRPAEDYAKLNLLFYLSKCYNTNNDIIQRFLKKYEEFYDRLILDNGIQNIDKSSYLRQREQEAVQLYTYVSAETVNLLNKIHLQQCKRLK